MRTTLSGLVILAAVWAVPAFALDEAELALRERAVLDLWARADFAAADAALGALLAEANASGDLDPALGRALGEVYLAMASTLEGLDRSVPALLIEQRAKLKDPVLAASVDWLRLNAALDRGKVEETAALASSLGFLDSWWICGPFDNERGAGFAQAYGPEGDYDLDRRWEGKARPVEWRALPEQARPVGGFIDLDALLRPNDQALGYALAAVQVKQPTPAAIRLGSDEGYKLWVNGRLVLEADLHRACGFDQDAAGVWLRKGWNLVLLKVTERKDAWGFRLRLTRPDGSPLEGWRAAGSREELAKAIASVKPFAAAKGGKVPSPEDDPGRAAPPIERGALPAIAARATDPGTPADKLRYGFLLLARGALDEQDHADADAFQAAAQAEAANPHPRYLAALALESTIFQSAEKEETRRKQLLDECLAVLPEHAPAQLELAGYYTDVLDIKLEALRHLRRALEIRPDYAAAGLALAEHLEARGWASESFVLLEALAAGRMADWTRSWLGGPAPAAGGKVAKPLPASSPALPAGDSGSAQPPAPVLLENPEALRAWAAALSEQRSPAAALPVLERAAALTATDKDTREALLDALVASARPERAEALALERLAIFPFDTALMVRAAGLAEALGRDGEAEAALRRALAVAPEEDELLAALGHRLMTAGKQDEAFALFARAVEVDPGRVELRRYVEYLQSSAKTLATSFLEDGRALIASAGEIEKNEVAVALLQKSVVKVHRDGLKQEFSQVVIAITGDKGAKEYDTMPLWYSAGEQRLRVHRAVVYHADGTESHARTSGAGMAGSSRDVDQEQTWRQYVVDLPPFAVGDAIEVAYELSELRTGFFGDYFGERHLFGDKIPVRREQFIVCNADRRELTLKSWGAVGEPVIEDRDAEGLGRVHTWTLEHLPRIEEEPLMPPLQEVQPGVAVSSFESWEGMGRWYWSLVKRQHLASPELKAKVRELCAGLDSQRDKARAIYNFVVTKIRYNDRWEFGIHGYKPYQASAIFARSFGDCKDKAILFNTMAAEVGIEAWPVLIQGEERRGEEDMSVPLTSYFNHCISFIPSLDGKEAGLFVDGTAQFASFGELPGMDYGARTLVAAPEGGKLVTIGYRPPEANGASETMSLALDKDGNAKVENRIEFRGDHAYSARWQYANPGERAKRFEEAYGRQFGGARVESVQLPAADELDAPMVAEVRASFPKVLQKGPDGLRVVRPEPVGWSPYFVDRFAKLASKGSRQQDLVLGNPRGLVQEVRYRLPAGAEVLSMPEARSLDTGFGTFRMRWVKQGNELILNVELKLSAVRIKVGEYGAFRAWAVAVDKAIEEQPVIKLPEAGE